MRHNAVSDSFEYFLKEAKCKEGVEPSLLPVNAAHMVLHGPPLGGAKPPPPLVFRPKFKDFEKIFQIEKFLSEEKRR
jgi:hypothetical protein